LQGLVEGLALLGEKTQNHHSSGPPQTRSDGDQERTDPHNVAQGDSGQGDRSVDVSTTVRQHLHHYRRLWYTRYCDDFLICFAGPKQEALAIKEALATFPRASLKLELSAAKSLITHAATHDARFLGYDILKQSGTRANKLGGRTLNGKLALRLPDSVIEEQSRPY